MRTPLVLITLAALALALTGTASAAGRTVVKTRSTSLGTILVDAKGRTLYLFRKDSGRKSQCTGACAGAWPPLIAHGKPKARGGAKQSRLSTSRRANGARQVLYKGHPLYRYAFDGGPGDTFGEGLLAFGARWYVLAPSGRAITH